MTMDNCQELLKGDSMLDSNEFVKFLGSLTTHEALARAHKFLKWYRLNHEELSKPFLVKVPALRQPQGVQNLIRKLLRIEWIEDKFSESVPYLSLQTISASRSWQGILDQIDDLDAHHELQMFARKYLTQEDICSKSNLRTSPLYINQKGATIRKPFSRPSCRQSLLLKLMGTSILPTKRQRHASRHLSPWSMPCCTSVAGKVSVP